MQLFTFKLNAFVGGQDKGSLVTTMLSLIGFALLVSVLP
jgi:hypothetical protein